MRHVGVLLRNLVGALIAMAVIVCVAIVWASDSTDAIDGMTVEEIEFASWVKQERRWNQIDLGDPHAMRLDPSLAGQADLQASRMAACSCLYHSPRGEVDFWLQQGWRSWGENVGVAATAWQAHQVLMRSPRHLANILDPQWRGFGVGVHRDAYGRVYVAEVFASF